MFEDENVLRSWKKVEKKMIKMIKCNNKVSKVHQLVHLFVTSFGDKDLDLRLANPLHLRAVLEDKRFSKCRIVLLHASYPFSREASYLAHVYSQVK